MKLKKLKTEIKKNNKKMPTCGLGKIPEHLLNDVEESRCNMVVREQAAVTRSWSLQLYVFYESQIVTLSLIVTIVDTS